MLVVSQTVESNMYSLTNNGSFVATFGVMFTITTGMTYLTDCYLPISASVVSAANFCRNLGAMIFSLPAVQIRGSLGDGWS